MSNDRKGIFKTEQECLEYEHRIEQERVKNEKLEMERQSRLNSINKKYENLQKEKDGRLFYSISRTYKYVVSVS